MKPRVLIVEDQPEMVESLADILAVLQHDCDSAGDMETARERLAKTAYAYLILDMAIPLRPGRFASREVGRQLLEEIRSQAKTARLPVLVVTGEDKGESDFIWGVRRVGGYEPPLIDYLQKNDPAFFDILPRRIQALLSGQPGIEQPAPPQKPTTAFSAQTRIVTVYLHRVDVCGVKIWDETESPDMRNTLLRLNRKDAEGRYVAIHGPELTPERNASNKIGKPIQNFRKSATKRLRADRDLDCGPEDIIANERRGRERKVAHFDRGERG